MKSFAEWIAARKFKNTPGNPEQVYGLAVAKKQKNLPIPNNQPPRPAAGAQQAWGIGTGGV